METLREAYQMARKNDGAPGIDGVTFEAIEESGAESFLGQIREELVANTYRGTPRRHLVAVPQEVPHSLVDVVIDRSIRHQPGPVTKVVRPPSQDTIQAITHVGPRGHVLAHQQVCHFLPQPGNALLRRTRPQIHMTILPKTMRPEGVSQKVETLSPCLLDAGLRFVQRKLKPGHHTPRPIQRLSRATATENHEIIGVVDHLGLENLTPSGDPPVLQKTVHIQVGEQGTDDSSYANDNFEFVRAVRYR